MVKAPNVIAPLGGDPFMSWNCAAEEMEIPACAGMTIA